MARLAGLAVFLVGHALALNYENEATRWHQVHEALKLDAPGEKLALTAMEGSPGGNLTAECEKCNTAVHLPASFCGNLGVQGNVHEGNVHKLTGANEERTPMSFKTANEHCEERLKTLQSECKHLMMTGCCDNMIDSCQTNNGGCGPHATCSNAPGFEARRKGRNPPVLAREAGMRVMASTALRSISA